MAIVMTILLGLIVWLLFGYITPFPGWIDLVVVVVGILAYGRSREILLAGQSKPSRRSPQVTSRRDQRVHPAWVVPEFPTSKHADLRLEWFEGDTGRGFVLVDESTDQRLNWRTLTWADGVKSINVVGEQYHLDELQDASFVPGREIALVHEQENEYDSEAVAVFDKNRSLHVGYLPSDDRTKKGALNRLKKNKLRGFVMWETLEGDERTGLRLLLTTQGAGLRVQQ